MLTAAGAAGKGFLRLANADLGYDPQNTMSLPIPVHDGTYQTWKERSEYFERLRIGDRRDAAGRVGRNLDQRHAAVERRRQHRSRFSAARLEKPSRRDRISISPEYFPLLRIPLAQGRTWSRDEIARGAALAVINQTMARQYWPNGDAIGRQFRLANLKDEPPYSPACGRR